MNLKQKTVSGLKWSGLQQAITQGSTFISGLILMRLLSPAEYGLMAMVAVVSSFLVVFQDLGITVSLIQKEKLEEDDKQVVFWMMFLTSIILALILFLGSSALANFYKEEQVEMIAQVLSLNILLGAFGSVNSALLRREMKFKPISLYRTFSVIIGAIAAIILAYQGFGVWALVWQSLLISILYNTLISFKSGFVPSLNFSWKTIREHVSFGLPLFGSRALTYFSKNTDKLMIGKIMSTSDLGIYSRAMNLVYLPIHQIGLIFTSVMYVSLTKIKSDKEKSLNVFGYIARITVYVMTPFLVLIFLHTKEIVLLIFGVKWISIVVLMKIFVIYVIFHLLAIMRGNIVVAQGKPEYEFRFNLLAVVVDLTAILTGVFISLEAVAVGLVLAAFIKFLFAVYQISKALDLGYSKVLNETAKALGAIIIVFFVSWFFMEFMELLHFDTIPMLVAQSMATILTLLLLVIKFDKPSVQLIRSIISRG